MTFSRVPESRRGSSPRRRSRTGYRHGLRQNRQRHVKKALGEMLGRAGAEVVTDAFLRDLISLQNRSRGALFEVMGDALLSNHLRREAPDVDLTVADRHCTVQTEFGRRIVDLWFRDRQLLVEVKSGYVCASKSIRRQITKDRWLLENNPNVERVVWVLFRGASTRTLGLLDDAGIEAIDIEYDVEDV